jgi:hypothetical protein
MNILEVAIWEFVAALAVFFLVILAQMPFAERSATMFRNEFSALRVGLWSVQSPLWSITHCRFRISFCAYS